MTAEELRKRKKTINAVIGWLRQALLMAWENGHVENERSWRCIRYLPNVDRPRIVFANRQECRRLVEACEHDIRNLVLAGIYTGCRISELQLMTVGDYVPERYGINVPLVKTKQPAAGRALFLWRTVAAHILLAASPTLAALLNPANSHSHVSPSVGAVLSRKWTNRMLDRATFG